MNEPMYQLQGPSREDIILDLSKCLCYKINDNILLQKLINEVVPNNNDFGSYRGYYTFLHPQYKNQILERYNYMQNNTKIINKSKSI